MELILWISLLFVLYTYIGYPLIIVLWSKLFPRPVRLNMESFEWPRVTLIIIAYNEEKHILRKIDNCRELDYPNGLLEICIVSDGSTDGTNDILIAQHDMHIIIDETNRGKPYQINRAVSETESEIIVFADARQKFEKESIKMLVRNFSDPEIGTVSGELVFMSPEDHTEQSIGFYWKYEKMLRKAESLVESTIGVTGAIYAIRRGLFHPIAEDTILDDVEIPLHIFHRGFRVIFEPNAKAHDAAHTDIHQEFRRKVRTLTGNYQIFSRNAWLFGPSGYRILFQALSHKASRLLIPYALIVMLVAAAIITLAASRVLFLILLAIIICGSVAIYYTPPKQSKIRSHISTFVILNLAAVVALYRYLFNLESVKWKQ